MSAWHDEAKRLRSEGWTLGQLSKRFGVTRQAVSQACNPEFYPRQNRIRAERYRNDTAYRQARIETVRDCIARRP